LINDFLSPSDLASIPFARRRVYSLIRTVPKEKRMNNKSHATPGAPVWEDLVHDLLDVSCAVAKDGRDFLCEVLRARNIRAEEIRRHSSFTIDRVVVVIREGGDIDECWFYDPKIKRVRKLIKSVGEYSREACES